jgi:hypothetical protein
LTSDEQHYQRLNPTLLKVRVGSGMTDSYSAIC